MIRRLFVAAALLIVSVALPTQNAEAAVSCADPVVLTGAQDGIAFPNSYRVNMDHWSGTIITGQTWQKMWVCDQTDWKSSNLEDGPPETGVKTYPASEKTYTDWSQCSTQPPLDTFRTLKTDHSHVAPGTGSYNFAYDLFIGSGACNRPLTEIMLFTDVHDVSLPTPQLSTTIDGIGYDIYYAPFTAAMIAERTARLPASQQAKLAGATGGYYIQMRLQTQGTSMDNVGWKHIFNYLEGQGILTMSDTLLFHRYGVEVLSTCTSYTSGCQGVKMPFYVDNFKLSQTFES